MRKVVLFVHVSLDGFVAGPKGEMDWVDTPAELFEFISGRVNQTDTALYGRTTYQMMEGYWPTAGEQPGATKHDIEHSRWYNSVSKVVLSNTLSGNLPNIRVIGGDLAEGMNQIKREADSEILMFGSPTTAHDLMAEDLIDGYWLFVNPVVLGKGIPLFKHVKEMSKLRLLDSKVFPSGVVCLNYEHIG
ncbi:MAG: dihydrofolate reductase [Meiothermus sp.]